MCKQARAVIESLREPSEAMLNAGSEIMPAPDWEVPSDTDERTAMLWQAMLEAILSETPEEENA